MKSIEDILSLYLQPTRHYHDINHIKEMKNDLSKFSGIITDAEMVYLNIAILFHDAVYDVQIVSKQSNEEQSVDLFLQSEFIKDFNSDEIDIIKNLIMVTETLKPTTKLETIMLQLDWSHFINPNIKTLLDDTQKIFREYYNVNLVTFKEKRREFLEGLKTNTELLKLGIGNGIDMALLALDVFNPTVGVYVGSFNPLHKGHLDIISKAQQVFDRVMAVQVKNPLKGINTSDNNVSGYEYHSIVDNRFIGDIVDELTNGYNKVSLIRGIRNGTDLDYEESYVQSIGDFGFKYPIVLFLSDPKLKHISSTSIRAAQKIGLDTKKWIN